MAAAHAKSWRGTRAPSILSSRWRRRTWGSIAMRGSRRPWSTAGRSPGPSLTLRGTSPRSLPPLHRLYLRSSAVLFAHPWTLQELCHLLQPDDSGFVVVYGLVNQLSVPNFVRPRVFVDQRTAYRPGELR